MVNKSVPYNEIQVGQLFTFDGELFIKHEDQENAEGRLIESVDELIDLLNKGISDEV